MTHIATKFRWKVPHFGCVDYEVHHASSIYIVTLRQHAADYERNIFNGGDAEWQRDVVASIGILHDHNYPDRPLPADLVNDFNAWRKAEYDRFIARMREDRHRYGDPSTFGDLVTLPMVADGGHYVSRQGWRRQDITPVAVTAGDPS